MARERELRVAITGDASSLNRSLDSAGGKMGKLGGKAKLAGAAAAAGVVAAGVAVAASINKAMGFENQMREVFTLLPGISKKAMDGMSKDVLGFSTEFGVLPEKVVPALYQSLSAGVPQNNVFEFLETAQMAARAGVTDLTTSVDGISSVMNAYGSDVLSATEASDQMFTAVRLGKTTFEEMSTSLSNVTPVAAGIGISFGEVAGSLATLTAQGIKTPQATTQLRAMFVELGKSGSIAAKNFEEMNDGISFEKFVKGGGTVEQALGKLAAKAKDSGTGLQNMFGSVEAGTAALALAKDTDKFRENVGEMGKSAGATKTAFETMSGGLQPVMDKIKAFADVAMIKVGQVVIPILMQAVEWVEKNWPAISAVFERSMAAISAAVEPLIVWFEKNWPMISEIASKAFAVIAAMVRKYWPQIQATIMDAVEAIGAVIAANVKVIQTVWDLFGKNIMSFVQRVWPRIQQIIQGAMDIIQGVIRTVTALIKGDWGAAWDGIKQVFRGVWSTIQGLVGAAMEFVRTAIANVLVVIGKLWGVAWRAIKAVVTGIWNTIKSTISTVINTIQSVISTALNVIKSTWNAAWSTVKTVASTVWNTIKSTISTVWNTIKSTISTGVNNAKTTAINGFQAIVNFVQGLPGKLLGFATQLLNAGAKLGGKIITGIIDGLSGFASGAAGFAGDAVAAIAGIGKDALNGIIGAINDLFPDEIGRIEVKGFTVFPGIDLPDNPIPSLHSGGRFQAPVPGGEGLAILRDGERVSSRGSLASRGGSGQTIQILIDGRVLTEAIVRDTNRNGPAQIRVAAR